MKPDDDPPVANASPTDAVIELPHLRLAALRWQASPAVEESAPPLLMLHGWLDNAASFIPLAPLLPPCLRLALELPGHGHSQHRPPGCYYHFVDYVSDVVAAVNALNWPRFDLMGHSLGAAIACFVAAVVPSRVRRLVLIEGLGPLSRSADQMVAQLAQAIEQTRHLRQRSPALYTHPEQAVARRQRSGDLGAEAARLLVERSLEDRGYGFGWRSDGRLLMPSPLYLDEPQIMAALARICCPTLLVEATEGFLAHRREAMAQRYRQIPQLSIEQLAGGHHLHMDNPAPTAAAARRFLTHPGNGDACL